MRDKHPYPDFPVEISSEISTGELLRINAQNQAFRRCCTPFGGSFPRQGACPPQRSPPLAADVKMKRRSRPFSAIMAACTNKKENAVADNILKKQIDCIAEDFLGEVYGKLNKPGREALGHLFGAITTGGSTLVSDIARPLRAEIRQGLAEGADERELLLKGAEALGRLTDNTILKRVVQKGLEERDQG